MKKKTKIIIIIVAVLLVGIAIALFCVMNHNAKYISKAEALDIAVQDVSSSGVTVLDTDIEFDKGSVTSFYEIDLKTSSGEYEYIVDASTGEILFSQKDIDD